MNSVGRDKLVLIIFVLFASINSSICFDDGIAIKKLETKSQANLKEACDQEKNESMRTVQQNGTHRSCSDNLFLRRDSSHFSFEDPIIEKRNSFIDTERWRFRYIDEISHGFEVKVLEESLDARLANLMYLSQSTRAVNFDAFTFESGNKQLDNEEMLRVSGPQVDDRLCGQHLEAILGQLDDLRGRLQSKRSNPNSRLNFSESDIRLSFYLDSFGRYESGQMLGKLYNWGSQEQCTKAQLSLNRENPNEFTGTRPCWARLSFQKYLDKSLLRRQRSPAEPKDTHLTTSVCLPTSCHSKSFTESNQENRNLLEKLVRTQFKLPDDLFLEESLPLTSVFCRIDENSDYGIPVSGKLFFLFLATWLLIVIYATWRVNVKEAKNYLAAPSASTTGANNITSSLLECLDLRQSWADFLCEKSADINRYVELDTLNPIKVFGCLFVVLGHALLITVAFSMNHIYACGSSENDPVAMLVFVGTVIVDTFFVITGILFSYLAIVKTQKKENSKKVLEKEKEQEGSSSANTSLVGRFFRGWAQFFRDRYFRLVPLMFLVFWFKKSVLIYWLRNNPFWDNGFNSETTIGACKRESWLSPLGFASALMPLSKQCLPQAWSISADLFFSLFVPPILIAFTRKANLAIAICCALALVSISLAHNSIAGVQPNLIEGLLDLRTHGFSIVFANLAHIYTYPHYRISSICVGLIAGYVLAVHSAQKGQNQTVTNWPAWFKGPITNMAITFHCLLFLGALVLPVIRNTVSPYHRSLIPLFFTTGRLLWAAANAVVFIRMTTDWKDSFLMQINRAKFWRILVKSNLAILLIHLDVSSWLISLQPELSYSKVGVLNLFASSMTICIPIGIFIHVFVENPLDKLTRRFILPKFNL